jgi:3-carboxy-cis,cis-muconate cycloisomerase
MSVSAFDHEILGGLFGDKAITEHLSAGAEIEAMVRFEIALAIVEARLAVIPQDAGPAIAGALENIVIDPCELTASTHASGAVAPGLVRILRERVGPSFCAYVH